jgi:hypothetical protein
MLRKKGLNVLKEIHRLSWRRVALRIDDKYRRQSLPIIQSHDLRQIAAEENNDRHVAIYGENFLESESKGSK